LFNKFKLWSNNLSLTYYGLTQLTLTVN